MDVERWHEVGDRLHHPGRGHTNGDLVVEVPDCSVSFVGDLVKENGPPGYRDSYPLEWPRGRVARQRSVAVDDERLGIISVWSLSDVGWRYPGDGRAGGVPEDY